MEAESTQKTFANFAAKRFCNNHSIAAEGKPLKKPLLKFSSYLDQEAARAVSFAIYNYTRDNPEPGHGAPTTVSICNHAISKMLHLKRVGLEIKVLDVTDNFGTTSFAQELISGLQQGSKGGVFSPYPLIQGRKTSNLDKVHLIGGLGILGPQLRDEIFCQVCKHINGNHSTKSQRKGWTLLACCLSLFLPSDEFTPYLENFIKAGPENERRFCIEKLTRTKQNGNRHEPVSFIEHESIAKRESLTRNVQLLNGRVCNCRLDSAITGLELRRQIKTAVGMVDLFGFSFRVEFGSKINQIVGGSDHVMDVVSSCEQGARELNSQGDWSIVFFKEIFSPWQTPSVDPKATELIYNQIISWVKSRRYKINEEDILAKIAATHCYVMNGPNARLEDIHNVVQHVIPNNLIADKSSKQKFVDATVSSFDKKFRHIKGRNQAKYVDELVNYAKYKMTGEFTRYFQLVQDVGNTESISTMSVNWNNIRVFQKQSLSSWTLAFPEIMKVSYEKFKHRRVGTVTIHTIHNDQRKLASLNAEEMHQLLTFFLSGLRKRSRYLLALRGNNTSDRQGRLEFAKGDLIILKGSCDGESVQGTGQGYGTCERSGSSGEFSGGLFYIIPTLQGPSAPLLETLRNGVVSDVNKVKVTKSVKPSQSVIRSGSSIVQKGRSSIVQKGRTSKSRENSEMFLELQEYENIRYPLKNPAAPNIHEILKPVTSQQSNGIEEIAQRPKRDMLFSSDNTSDDYLDLSGPPISKHDNFYQYDKNVERTTEQFKDFFIHSGKSGSKSSSTRSEGSTKITYEEMVSVNTVTTTAKSFPTLVTTVNVLGNTDQSITDQDITNHIVSPDAAAFVQTPQTEKPNISLDPPILSEETEIPIIPENSGEIPNENNTTPFVKNGDNTIQPRETTSFKDSLCYKAIITYVSQAAGDISSEMKLTDAIFGKPILKIQSENDVYLEIMKNIKAEENETIVERSWELMWLTTGLYPCSEEIKDDVVSFLRARTDGNPLARQCYTRLVKMITHGRRTYSPHVAEVQAIQTRMDLINHKVFFPDGSCQSFEVESATTARHLISVITESIGIKYPNGCGLFFKIGEKVFGAADEYFFFDFIQHFIEVWNKDGKGNTITANYQVFFLRKVWISVIPGADRVADCRLHYYQELSKYLRGYHKCTKVDSIALAALVFRAEFGEDTDNLSEIPDTLNKLVPQDVISEMSVDEWEQTLGQALSENTEFVGDDAKVEFLKQLSKLPTFGSAFFHAKPKLPSDLPETTLIAIQKDGFALMTDVEKKIIEKYAFEKVLWWSSGEHIFRVDVETMNGKKRLEFETSLDYQIDDFLTSYISVYGSEHPAEESITFDDE